MISCIKAIKDENIQGGKIPFVDIVYNILNASTDQDFSPKV